jgi:hypothetical protein
MHFVKINGSRALGGCAAGLFLVLAIVTSCSSLGNSQNNLKDFGFAVDQFHNAMRWEKYDIALLFVSPKLADDFYRLTDLLQDKIRIMEYEIRNPLYNPQDRSGLVTVHFKLYHCDGPRLQTKTVQERWVYMNKENRWQIAEHDLKELMH